MKAGNKNPDSSKKAPVTSKNKSVSMVGVGSGAEVYGESYSSALCCGDKPVARPQYNTERVLQSAFPKLVSTWSKPSLTWGREGGGPWAFGN